MWFALIAALLGMSALTIIQTPREWLKRPLPLALLILFHAAGIASILLILFAVYRMQDGPLRELIIWTETVYVTVAPFSHALEVSAGSCLRDAPAGSQLRVADPADSLYRCGGRPPAQRLNRGPADRYRQCSAIDPVRRQSLSSDRH